MLLQCAHDAFGVLSHPLCQEGVLILIQYLGKVTQRPEFKLKILS